MAPHDDLLQTMCNSEETLSSAQAILRLALQKTGPGSGFELGSYKTGLPAICAYIASTRLNNSDVTRNNAQAASCLKMSDFNKALDTVKVAIETNRRTRSGKDTYDTLIQRYASTLDSRQFSEWMAAVKNALIQTDERFGANNSDGLELKCAIFFWTFHAATGKDPATQQDFAAEHGVSANSLNKFIQKINTCCTFVKTRIKNDLKVQRSPTKASVTATPRRTPKRPARILPSRDSPTKRKAAELPAPLESDEEMDSLLVPETPSKKRKSESSIKPALASPTKIIFPPLPSSSRITLDYTPRAPAQSPRRSAPDDEPMDVDDDVNAIPTRVKFEGEEEEEEEERPVRRRFRPVYLDHKQWYAVDKRVKRMWKQAERYKTSMVELHGPLEIRV
ncbi:hypothetical protein C0991_001046 [Blastosporella zonata]|nr:hypothetical protein C0991_001046 [Blastosporella zonata]